MPLNQPDFTSEAFARDPSATIEQLREQGDVVRVKMPIMGKVWMTLSYAATVEMLKDNSRFTMRTPGKTYAVAGMQWWMPKSVSLLANNMLTSDEPEHRRLRKLVDQAFQRRAVSNMEPMIAETAARLLKEASVAGDIELVSTFCRRLPLLVICDLLGLGDEQTAYFSTEAAKLTRVTGMVDFLRAIGPIRRMRKTIGQIIDQERSEGGGAGLIAELVRAEADGEQLSHDELIAMVFLLLMAGHETTTHLISGSALTLLQNPQKRAWLFEKEDRLDMAVEEFLRFVSPVQFSKPRIVRQGGVFHGAELGEGDRVMAMLAAANSDPAQFERPNELDLARKPNPHLEFGTGIHFCLGFQLARLELKTALNVLFERWPDLQLSNTPPAWQNRLGLRALKSLHVRNGNR